MKFVKSAFLSVVFACVGSLCVIGGAISSCVNYNDSNRTCGGARPATCAGSYCYMGIAYKCDEKCYCTGGMSQGDGLLSHCNPANGTFKFGAISHSSSSVGVHVCPSGDYQFSDDGAGALSDCYMHCNNKKLHNMDVYCSPTKYLPAGKESSEDCPAGYACAGNVTYHTNCTNDQGREKCYGLNYAAANSSACSTCDADGKAVVKNGDLHIGCEACDAGKYTLDHQNCHDCPVGYSCQSGIRHKCTGKTYSDVEGLAECKVCSGDKKGVTYATTTVNGQTETLQTGCGICPNGKYGNDGVCEPCTAGYRCLNGEKTICAKGYYSAAGAVSCTHCPNFFTTEGPGTAWTPDANVPCTVAHIYLKNANSSGNGIMFPACLNRGDINERVLYSN